MEARCYTASWGSDAEPFGGQAGYHPTVRVAAIQTGMLVAAGVGVLGWAVAPAPIAGSVVDSAGQPVSQATVAAASLPLGRATTALTDSSGAYRLLGYL